MEEDVHEREHKKYLETTFWSEDSEAEKDSDDEGIGSDESMDQMEQCSCFKDERCHLENLSRSNTLTKQSKDPQRVTKFLRGLKQSILLSTSSLQLSSRRVFGVSLDQCADIVPQIVDWCTRTIEERGKNDMKSLEGVYRLSGQVSHIKALQLSFDAGHPPTIHESNNIHSVGSLLKLYFRELPEPVCTFHLYGHFVRSARLDPAPRLSQIKTILRSLPEPHYRTLSHLMAHLHHLSLSSLLTGMTCCNLAIVWAPNLLRSLHQKFVSLESLRDIGVQAKVVECFIENYHELFSDALTREISGNSDKYGNKSVKFSSTLRSHMDLSIRMHSPNSSRKSSFEKQITRYSSLPRFGKRCFKKALSSSYISTNSTFIWTPTVAHKASFPKSTYKSLPALDKHFDQVDTELHTLSDSVDVLYQQEDKEIEFLENFIDYDSISIVCKENVTDIRTNNPDIVNNLQDNKSEGLPPTMANEKGKRKSRKEKIRERLRWLTSRSKLTMRNFGSPDNLQNMKEGLQKSKERLSSALSPARNRRGSYEWSVRLNCEGQNVRDSIIVMDGGEGNMGEEVIKDEANVDIKSFEVPVLKVKENDNKRKPKFTKFNKSKNGKSPEIKDESVKPLEDLEKLERLVLRDSVRETLQKRREMCPINEELDLAFNNLSYDALDISDASRKYYENIDATKSNTDRMYENVQTDYENASVSNQHYENFPNIESHKTKAHADEDYENFPNKESHKMQTHADEDYENYDFGESGIYQNILYDKSANAIIVTDLSSQVHTLRKSVNEVDKIVEESNPIEEVESQPLRIFQSKMNIQLMLPNVNGTKQGVDNNQVTDTNSLDRKPLNDENEQKSEAKLKPSTIKKNSKLYFQKMGIE